MKESLFFADGDILSDGSFVLAGQFDALPDVDASRICIRVSGDWLGHDCRKDMIRSATFSKGGDVIYLLGRHGLVRRMGTPGEPFSAVSVKGTAVDEQLEISELDGELFRIRSFGSTVYACGQGGQVHRLGRGRWERFDAGIAHIDAETLEDIDGFSDDDLYVVGRKGTCFHFDGKAWRRIYLPTNVHLSNVRCLSDQRVLVCGNHGAVLVGQRDQWTDISNDSVKEIFWGACEYNGQIYFSSTSGLWLLGRNGPEKIQLPLEGPATFGQLARAEKYLLSIGTDHVLRFDGVEWERVIWPGNREKS